MASRQPEKSDDGRTPPEDKSYWETKIDAWKEYQGGPGAGAAGAAIAITPEKIVKSMMQRSQELMIKEMQWKAHLQNLQEQGFLERALSVVFVGSDCNRKHVGITISLLIAALTKPPFNG